MKKTFLTIALSTLMLFGWSQPQIHLDSSYHYSLPDSQGDWQYTLKSIYDPNTPKGADEGPSL